MTFDARSVGCVGCGDLTGVVLAEEEAETMLRLVQMSASVSNPGKSRVKPFLCGYMISVRGPDFAVPLGFTINAAMSDGARAVLESLLICKQISSTLCSFARFLDKLLCEVVSLKHAPFHDVSQLLR